MKYIVMNEHDYHYNEIGTVIGKKYHGYDYRLKFDNGDCDCYNSWELEEFEVEEHPENSSDKIKEIWDVIYNDENLNAKTKKALMDLIDIIIDKL